MENISKSWQDNIEDNSQSNQRDDFDREYGLSELLSLSVVEELCIAIQKVAPTSIALLTQDGTLFYAMGSMVSDNVEFNSSRKKQK